MRIFLRIVSSVILLCVLLLGAATIYLTYTLDAEKLAASVEESVFSATGLTCRLRGTPPLRIGLWPVLSVQADDVVVFASSPKEQPARSVSIADSPSATPFAGSIPSALRDASGFAPAAHGSVLREVFSVGTATATMKLLPLLSGSFEIDRVQLVQPRINLTHLAAVLEQHNASSKAEQGVPTGQTAGGEKDSAAGSILQKFRISGVDIIDGFVQYTPDASAGEPQTDLIVSGINVTLDAAANLPWAAEALVTYGRSALQVGISGTIEHTDYTVRQVQADVKVTGHADINSRLLPVTLTAFPRFTAASNALELKKTAISLASLGVQGDIYVSDALSPQWNAKGNVHLSDFSLPFWFGFTEGLPSSLNHALDALTGDLQFTLTADGLWAEDLRAEVLGMPLHGSGGIPDFSKPAIVIDVAGELVNVDTIFPEIGQNPPKVLPLPRGTERPVLAYDGEEADDDEGWGYDIRVAARNATARGLSFQGLRFRCWPTDDNLATQTTYDIEQFYGGSVQSVLTFREDMILDAVLKDVTSDAPVRILFEKELMGGRLNANANLASRGATVAELVATMRGSISATLAGGYVSASGRRDAEGKQPLIRYPLQDMKIRIEGKGEGTKATLDNPHWPYWWDGSLQYTVPATAHTETATARRAQQDTADTYAITLKGPVWVETASGMPVRTSKAAFQFKSTEQAAPFGPQVEVHSDLSGVLTCDLEAETLDWQDITGRVAGAVVKGSVYVTEVYGQTAMTGEGALATASLRTVLSGLGVPLWQGSSPDIFSTATLRGSFAVDEHSLELKTFLATLDETTLQGSIAYNHAEVDTWRVKLAGDVLNVDNYLPPSDDMDDNDESASPWELGWLSALDLSGRVAFSELLFKKLSMENLSARLEVRNGNVRVEPIVADMYGGTAEGTFFARVADGLDSRINIKMSDVSLEPAVTAVFGSGYVGGVASAYVNATGVLRSADDWPAAISGVWGTEVKDGFYRLTADTAEQKPTGELTLQEEEEHVGTSGRGPSRSSFGRAQSGRTAFSLASADGAIKEGVLTNDNLTLQSLLVSMQGKGWIDFVAERIDYTVNVTFARIPTFPVRVHGALKTPETTVRQSRVLPETLGRLGGGIFSIFRGVLTSPFTILDALGNAVRGEQEKSDE